MIALIALTLISITLCGLALVKEKSVLVMVHAFLTGAFIVQLLMLHIIPPLTKFETVLKDNGYTVTKVK